MKAAADTASPARRSSGEQRSTRGDWPADPAGGAALSTATLLEGLSENWLAAFETVAGGGSTVRLRFGRTACPAGLSAEWPEGEWYSMERYGTVRDTDSIQKAYGVTDTLLTSPESAAAAPFHFFYFSLLFILFYFFFLLRLSPSFLFLSPISSFSLSLPSISSSLPPQLPCCHLVRDTRAPLPSR